MRERERQRLVTDDGALRDIAPAVLDVRRRLQREQAIDALDALDRLSDSERQLLGLKELGLR